MIRIQFDVVMTMVVDTLYKILAKDLKRFEYRSPYTLFSKFVSARGGVTVKEDEMIVNMRKRAHTPILKSNETFKKS